MGHAKAQLSDFDFGRAPGFPRLILPPLACATHGCAGRDPFSHASEVLQPAPACTGDNRGPQPAAEQQQQASPQPQGEEAPKEGLSDDDWMELMAMAEAQPPQQPHANGQQADMAQANAAPGELLRHSRRHGEPRRGWKTTISRTWDAGVVYSSVHV